MVLVAKKISENTALEDFKMAKKTAAGAAGSWSDTPGRDELNQAHADAMGKTPIKGAPQMIELPKLDIRLLDMHIISDAELIVHHWSEKAIKEMLDKQMGVPTAGKEPKNPKRDYEAAFYYHPDGGYGFPAIAFKCAAVEACTSLGKSVTKVQARQAFHVVGELVKIEGTPHMRQDMVRLNGTTADVRHRPGFTEWSTQLTVRYNARVLTAEQVVNLFNAAGFAVGVGEWRSERDGSFGLFHVG
jgi:hypothetical protein